MSDVAIAIVISVIWLSCAGLAALWMVQRIPPPKKPLERDALEAADSALRLRINDLEDKFETYTKREAVRSMRARREDPQQELPLTREQRKADLIRRWNSQRGGIPHGTAG